MATFKSKRDGLLKFEISTVELSTRERKGSGCFGEVHKVLVNGIPRIAKRLLNILLDQDIIPQEREGIQERFYNECQLLSKLDHPNVVEFIGIHFSQVDHSDVTLIMECLHMDLEKFMKCSTDIPLSIKLSILLDVSFGLTYLHTQLEEPLIHRDLTSGNILLTEDLRAKIADLGVSKLLKHYPNNTTIHTKCPGTLSYMPPEALCENPRYNTSLDIFSFGQLSLYTVSQQFPFVFNATHDPKVAFAIQSGEVEILRREKWITMLPKDHCLRNVILQCLQDEPCRRPPTKDLNCTMKTLCVIHPKTLDDAVSVWAGEARVSC